VTPEHQQKKAGAEERKEWPRGGVRFACLMPLGKYTCMENTYLSLHLKSLRNRTMRNGN
jgi:hypothetical protein